MTEPRAFHLVRDVDVSGVSGVGIVAEGVVFSDGVAVLRWLGDFPTSVVFHDRGMESIEHVHGHGGSTHVVYIREISDRDHTQGMIRLTEALRMLHELRRHEQRHYGNWTGSMRRRVDEILLKE